MLPRRQTYNYRMEFKKNTKTEEPKKEEPKKEESVVSRRLSLDDRIDGSGKVDAPKLPGVVDYDPYYHGPVNLNPGLPSY